MRRLLTITALALTLAAVPAAAATYKWVDKDGKVHYSDQPQPGAKKVELKPLTEIPSAEPRPAPEPPAEPAAAAAGTAPAAVAYTALRITYPEHEQTLRAAEGLNFSVMVEPRLGPGDSVEYTLDGQPVPAKVDYVERGSHTVSARVVGSDGAERIAAEPVTFFVHQTIVRPTRKKEPPKKPPIE